MIGKEKIEAYALENAVSHKGKTMTNPVLNALFAEGLKKEEVKDFIKDINEIVEKVNSMPLEEQEKRYHHLKEHVKKREVRVGLPELENTEKVVMRFAPFPSGPLHIGNTRQLVLNDEYAKKYHGKLILVFDDTIGSDEKPIEPKAYDLIEEGIKWMNASYDKIVYKSERLETYYEYAEELIKKGYMYVCSCPQDRIRGLRTNGIACSCRSFDEKEQLERWKKMFNSKEGEFVVRLKTNMQDPNPAFRDRVMFKISDKAHPKTGKKYRIWPLMEFSWAIDDHLLGITHILRGIDLMMETKVEGFIWDIFKWKKPIVIHTGFLAIEGVKISKSKGAKEVKAGKYIGWNDPRTWSLQSLRDRGILPETIREFILSMGITKSNSKVAVDVLYALNRKYLEKVPRFFFVPNPVKIKINGTPEITAKVPMHPTERLGVKEYHTNQDFYVPEEDMENMMGGNCRLMHLLNFKSDKVLLMKERTFHFISQNPDDNLNVKYIQWLPANTENFKVTVRMPDNSVISGLGEPALLTLNEGDIVQFERFGFVRLYNMNKKDKKAEFWFTHK